MCLCLGLLLYLGTGICVPIKIELLVLKMKVSWRFVSKKIRRVCVANYGGIDDGNVR